jgi:hypothetical protein
MDQHNFQKKKRILFLGEVFFIASLLFCIQPCAENSSIEYKIKAGYLYNFTKFITWPENESATFNLCIVGEDPFGSIIDPIEKRTVKDKPIHLYRLHSTDDLKHCHLVYFTLPEQIQLLSGVLTISSLNQTLTVSESKKFVYEGGMIGFFLKEGNVKLHINLAAVRKGGLDVSAKLLEVAEVYEGESND